MKTVDVSETIEACDLKFGRYRQLIEIMKVQCGQHIFPTLPFTRRNRLSRNSGFLSRNNILKNFYSE